MIIVVSRINKVTKDVTNIGLFFLIIPTSIPAMSISINKKIIPLNVSIVIFPPHKI